MMRKRAWVRAFDQRPMTVTVPERAVDDFLMMLVRIG
jgi:hypothetical protein